MPRITMTEAQDFSVFPADTILLLKVQSSEVREAGSGDRTWQSLDVKFKVLEIQVTGDGSPVGEYQDQVGSDIYGGVSFKFTDHPENKLRLWAEAIFGMELGIGFELDTDLFDGKLVRGITEQYEKRSGGGKRHKIGSLLPYGTQLPSPASAAAAQTAQQQAALASLAASGFTVQQPAPAPQPTAQATLDPWAGEEPPF